MTFFVYQDEEEKDDGEAKEISTPTHWSKLDPKSMKVTLQWGDACCEISQRD